MNMDFIRIDCESHRKPHHVIAFHRGLTASSWEVLRPYTAQGNRELASHRQQAPDERAEGIDGFLQAMAPGPDGPSSQTTLRTLDDGSRWEVATPLAVAGERMVRPSIEARDVFEVKCDRCHDGRSRRAENLYPLLGRIIDTAPPSRIGRRVRITLRQFWAIADRWDALRRAGMIDL